MTQSEGTETTGAPARDRGSGLRQCCRSARGAAAPQRGWEAPVPRYSTAFGMGARLRSTTVCALDAETGEAVARRFRGNPWGEVAEWVSGFPGPSLAAYESGYLGFAPQGGAVGPRRRLRRRGRLQGPGVGGRPLVQERPRRRGQDGRGDTVARRRPGMGC